MSRITLGLMFVVCSFSAAAVDTLWPAKDTVPSRFLKDWSTTECTHKAPKPYTGSLDLESKYAQTDDSKSEVTSVSKKTERSRHAIDSYVKGVVKFLTQYERAKDTHHADLSLSCVILWMEHWASSKAMLSKDTSNTGKAVRKWFLAAMGAVVLKAQALSNDKYRPSQQVRNWLNDLADAVVADYGPRQTLEYKWFNNHDYWAAWAVATVAMVNDRATLLAFAEKTLLLALEQGKDAQSGALYWPLEVGRASLGADYSNYALVPVALLAQTMEANGKSLSSEQMKRLGRLADFAAQSVMDPKALQELTEEQHQPGYNKLNWVLPLLSVQPEHQLGRKLKLRYHSDIGFYGQVGGDLRMVYQQFF